MPVLSPHRSSASSGLNASYRSSYTSSPLDRTFFGSSSYSPRISSYSERYSSRSYADSDGRRVYSRTTSITEDGVTSRFREETREGSGVRRADTSSILEYPRRDSSLSRLSSLNVVDSVAELRHKYSPSSYVPAVLRNDNISRSKSINDIGLPPIEGRSYLTSSAGSSAKSKKVNEGALHYSAPHNSVLLFANNPTNHRPTTDNMTNEEDSNGNRTTIATASVADLRKKFDCAAQAPLCSSAPRASFKHSSASQTQSPIRPFKRPQTESTNGAPEEEELIVNGGGCAPAVSRVNDFASYIPVKGSGPAEEEPDHEDVVDSAPKENGGSGDVFDSNDLSSGSPNLPRAAISPLGRRSTERDAHKTRIGYDDDEGGTTLNGRASSVKTLGLNGLKNIGNTCFMNSVIQCLSNTKIILEYIRKDGYMKDINTTISGMKGALIKAFAEVMKELWAEDASDRVVNTVSLKSQIQRFAPRFMGYAQQDAQEFLRYLLEGLHEDVNRVTEKPKPIVTEIDEKLSDVEKANESWSRYLRMDNSRIVDYFVGQLKSTLKCTHCGHCSVTFDPFWDLSLPMPQRTGQLRLSQCLDSFTREETLDGDEKPTCSRCKERRKCTKSFSIHKFPKILVIHLKRFSPTERFRGKLNVTVDFPLEGLDMSNYAADGIVPCRYNLYAISNHSGTTYSGHYTAYCRHPFSQTWHEYNDSRVSSISARSIVSSEAYVLFYEQETLK